MNLAVTDLKTFIPSKDFASSKAFYKALGCTINWDSPDLSQLQLDEFRFYLQNFYHQDFAENMMLQATVLDLDAWWHHLQTLNLPQTFPGTAVKPPQEMPWGQREIHLIDPAGVCWHFVAA